MAFIHSKEAVIKVDDDGGTLRDLSGYIKSVSWSPDIDMGETNVLSADSKTRLPGLKDGKLSLEGPFDTTCYGYFDGAWGNSLTFELYPNGTGSGAPKITGECYMASMECGFDVDNPASFQMELVCTGDVTVSLVP